VHVTKVVGYVSRILEHLSLHFSDFVYNLLWILQDGQLDSGEGACQRQGESGGKDEEVAAHLRVSLVGSGVAGEGGATEQLREHELQQS